MESSSDERLSKLFVGGINRETTKNGLRSYFEKFGEVVDCVVITDSNTKESRGFGYVTFKDHRSTKDVLNMKEEGKPHVIDGKECEVKRAIPRDSANEFAHQSTNKIFIGGLPEDAKEDDIKEMITSNLGKPPKSIVLLMRKEDDTKNRGFCFVDLPTDDDADTLFCLKRIDMLGKKVEIKKADPRGKGERGRGRGQADTSRGGYSNAAQYPYSQGANSYYSGAYMGSGYGSVGQGSSYGYGIGGYGNYDRYRSTTAYTYDNMYGMFGSGYASGYGPYDSYSRMGMYSQSASGYGPMKGYGMNGSTGYGGSAGYRPY